MFLFSKLNPTAMGAIRNLEEEGFPFQVLGKSFLEHLSVEAFDPAKFIVPTSDEDNRDLFTFLQNNKIPGMQVLPSLHSLSIAVDKYTLYSALSGHGIPTPETTLMNAHENENIRFSKPYVLKPCFSGDWKTCESAKTIGEQKAITVRSQTELDAWMKVVEPFSGKLIVQEIIDQKGDENFSFCGYSDKNGKVLWGFLTQKILQYPPGFGTALLCRSVKNKTVCSFGQRVVETLELEGIFEVEMIRNKQNEQLYVIEINLRHWGQHRISTRMGVNITLLDYYYRTGQLDCVRNMMSNAESKPILWIDDLGYAIHCVKNLFNPKSCRFSLLLGSGLECSMFSIRKPIPFLRNLKKKFK